jgi:hypothetical protein
MSAEKPTAREFAAVVYALAVARGVLSSVQLGDTEAEELKDSIERILKGTSAANIAKALGLKEADITMDWNELLTELQMHLIGGGDDA